MREIKFRVWNGVRMTYDVTAGRFGTFYVNPGAKGDGLDEKDKASLTRFTTSYPKTKPPMQFTGLHDKNGVEIYESDIVTSEGLAAPSDIIFAEGTFAICYSKTHDHERWMPIAEDSGVEIIGNIYSNPELLTPKEPTNE